MTTAHAALSGGTWLADSGLETDLVFNHGFDLPEFASFALLADERGRATIEDYYAEHLRIAVDAGTGIVLETPTWRGSRRWGDRLGLSADEVERANHEAAALLRGLAMTIAPQSPLVISGSLGPRYDAYQPEYVMGADEAAEYHSEQMGWLVQAGVDAVSAMTLTHRGETIGFAEAAREHQIPIVLSFTTETDGRLPDGTNLADMIEEIDSATSSYASYYMVNCAHPTHFFEALTQDAAPLRRVRGIRANASRMSHAELDEAEELDAGDPVELAEQYAALRAALPQLNVFGGCCGTDARHIASIARALA